MKAFLTALVACGFCVSLAAAQAPVSPSSIRTAAAAEPVYVDLGVPVGDPIVPQRNRPVQNTLNRHGLGCYAHHNETMGCGSFCSEMRFIFGSCRTFFGQPCIPNPPHFQGRRNGGAGMFGAGDCGCK